MLKRFIIYSISLVVLLGLVSFIMIKLYTRGYVDDYYQKYIHPKTNSLIIGSSRALQGLNPDLVFKNTEYEANALNFAFTSANSPFGNVYLEAIKKVVDRESKNGIFIIEVSPLAISSVTDSITGKFLYPEANLPLAHQNMYAVNPNIEYIFKHYEKPLYKLFIQNNKTEKLRTTHSNGWLELNFDLDTLVFKKREIENFRKYKQTYPKHSLDSVRIQKLNETIVWLADYGKVYLVRLPVSPNVFDLENEIFTNFNGLMLEIASRNQIEYIELKEPSGAIYTHDGAHLHRFAAAKVSTVLNKLIFKDNCN